MSLFASQFNYANAYNPVGLDTGVPQVGLNLPRAPDNEEEKTPTEKSPVRAPISSPGVNPNTANAEANANASESQGANQNFSAMIDAPAKVAALNTAAAPAAQPGIWGQVTHGVASGFDAARHGIATGADAVNGVATNHYVKDVMNFGNVLPDNGGLMGMINPVQASTVAPSAQQDIKVNSMRLNQGSPTYDVETPQYALPRGWSANAVGSGNARPAIEAPGYTADPLQGMINEPNYSAMPRGWSANAGEPNFSSMVDAGQGGARWSANMNPIQFNDIPGNASPLPRGMSANGGWESDIGNILGDIGDALG